MTRLRTPFARRTGQALLATPGQIEGPFYPLHPDPHAGDDLTRRPGATARARGATMRIVGRVLSVGGDPLAGVLVEAWQCDANGRYPHPDAPENALVDPNFEGYGRSRTGADGAYGLLALRPVGYPGRAPHLHLKVTAPDGRQLITQMYIAGEAQNDTDFALWRAEAGHRARLIAELRPAGADGADFKTSFDIVLGEGEG